MTFFQELKRRNVFRVGITYVLLCWVLLQGADFALDLVDAPNWVIQALTIVVIAGLPIALVIAWAFELTPDGVRRAEDVDPGSEQRKAMGVLHYVVMFLVVGLISWGLYQLRPAAEESSSTQTQVVTPSDPAEPSDGTSIAVLPFVNMSGDDSQEYFSDGISEELLNVLAGVPGLSVASRTSSFAFKGANRNIREIASILEVGYIVEGSVRKAGNTVRITAQLIDTAADKHLWSETFDRELDDIFAIQDEISNAIVSALQGALGLEAGEIVAVHPVTQNMDAYDLYLQALGKRRIMSIESQREQTELLQQAVEIDPEFTLAWASLAGTLTALPTWDHSLDIQEYTRMARSAAERALELAPDNLLANIEMAEVLASQYDWPAWYRQVEVSRELLHGNTPEAQRFWSHSSERWLGLGYLNRARENAASGLEEMSNNAFLHLIKAMALLDLRQREEALLHLEQAILWGYAGGASDQIWEYIDPVYEKAAWTASTAMYFQDHEPQLLPLLPHLSQVRFAAAEQLDLERRRFWQVATELGYSRDDILGKSSRWGYRLGTDMLAALGEYQIIADQYWGNSPHFWMWSPALESFRASEPFRANVRSSGMLAFWQEFGWPDLCRPVGEDDFECD